MPCHPGVHIHSEKHGKGIGSAQLLVDKWLRVVADRQGLEGRRGGRGGFRVYIATPLIPDNDLLCRAFRFPPGFRLPSVAPVPPVREVVE